MKPESILLKYIAKEIVYGGYKGNILKIIGSSKINWVQLQNLLLYHEIAHFLYIITRDSTCIPEEFGLFLKDAHYRQLAWHMILYEEFVTVINEAQKKYLMLIPIKGLSYPEQYYSRWAFRPQVDIDLLIKKADFEKGTWLIKELGYKKYLLGASEDYWRKKQYHLEFIKVKGSHKIILELHWALDYERKNREILPDLWARLKKISIGELEFCVISPEDTLISLVLHQRRFGKMLNLKYACDAGIILEKENLDWKYIIEAAFLGRFRAALFFFLAQLKIVLDKDVDENLQKLRIPYWQRKAIFAIIKKYTYASHKDSNLYYLYLACYFLLFDNTAQSLLYILNIPEEQFAKFYGLPIYARKTKVRYRIRFVYVFYRLIKDNLGKIFLHQ